MFDPFLAVGEPSNTPTWLALLTGGGIVAALTGVFGIVTKRMETSAARRQRGDDRAADNVKEATAGHAAVEVERLKVEASERERVFMAWQANEAKAEAAVAAIRVEMHSLRRTMGHELRNLQQYNQTILDMYHACYSVLRDVLTQCRMMRARLKRQAAAAGEPFDEDEFPPVDASGLDPSKIPKFTPTNALLDPGSDGDAKKISGKVTLSPDTQ